MITAFVSAEPATNSPAPFVVILLLLVAIGWPLLGKLRKSISQNRKQRWVDQGLMNPPPDDPEPGEPTDRD